MQLITVSMGFHFSCPRVHLFLSFLSLFLFLFVCFLYSFCPSSLVRLSLHLFDSLSQTCYLSLLSYVCFFFPFWPGWLASWPWSHSIMRGSLGWTCHDRVGDHVPSNCEHGPRTMPCKVRFKSERESWKREKERWNARKRAENRRLERDGSWTR